MVNVAAESPTIEQIWDWLAEVPDPEIPVISVTDLGVVRDVAWQDGVLVVTVTPTYSGCPATRVIGEDIAAHLRAKGVADVRVAHRLSPPWTTDWIGEEAREKLRTYGIAPPVDGPATGPRLAGRIARLGGAAPTVSCPRCRSTDTERLSQFGSTPCKAAYRCRACLEPFDYFKCL